MSGIDLWWPKDIRRILAAARAIVINALAVAPVTDRDSDAYRRGCEDTLGALAILFGVDKEPVDDWRIGPGQYVPPGKLEGR